MKVKLLSVSQCRNSTASAASSAGTDGGGAAASSSAMEEAVRVIRGQSSTVSRTSRSTRASAASIAARSAASVSRSISMCIHDSTTASGGTSRSSSRPRPTSSSRRPSRSRRTTNCGCTTRCTPRPSVDSSAVRESTRKGMSSVTTCTTVWGQPHPFSSTVGRQGAYDGRALRSVLGEPTLGGDGADDVDRVTPEQVLRCDVAVEAHDEGCDRGVRVTPGLGDRAHQQVDLGGLHPAVRGRPATVLTARQARRIGRPRGRVGDGGPAGGRGGAGGAVGHGVGHDDVASSYSLARAARRCAAAPTLAVDMPGAASCRPARAAC